MPHGGRAGTHGKSTEATLKIFRRHSRSPGVRDTVRDAVRRAAKSKRRQRKSGEKTYCGPTSRSPMLVAAKYRRSLDNLQQVRDGRELSYDTRRERKLQDVLGIAMSDTVANGEDSDHWTHLELHLSRSLSEICRVEDEPRIERNVESSPDIRVCRVSGESDVRRETNSQLLRQSWSSLKLTAEDARQLSRGLEPADMLKTHPFLTTMADHVRHLKTFLENQEGYAGSSECDSEEEDIEAEDISPFATYENAMAESFLLGEPAVRRKPDDDVIVEGTTAPYYLTPPPWSGPVEQVHSFEPWKAQHHSGRFWMEKDEVSFMHDLVNDFASEPENAFRCMTSNPFVGASTMDVDRANGLSPELEFSTEVIRSQSPTHCHLFESLRSPAPEFEFGALDSSPGLEDYERLAKRSLTFPKEEDLSPPNFFSVPRPLI